MNILRKKAIEFEYNKYGFSDNVFVAGFVDGYEQGKADAKADIAKECKYLLNCGMGKKKSLEHLIKILEKGKK